jgi:uncharacterized membrane protein YhiD involved in acid resistance
MFSRRFILDALERCIKTFAQTLAAALPVGSVVGFDWKAALATAGLATLASVLTSIASFAQKDSISPASLVPPT